jgi:aldehyde:ferredoxin oxidoreductase
MENIIMLGYAGRILLVDLSTGKIETQPLKEETAKKYIGGIGLGMYLYLENSKPGIDPFSAENPLIVTTGPLSGTMVPTGGNGHAFVSKSPQTFGVGEAKAHGHWGTALKRAGYDGIIFTGKAEKPVYLWIDDDSVQLMDAKHLWGKSPQETEDIIRDELKDFYIRVACIGVAGEKLVRIACIINDKTRACGRTGLGAVMGAKKLKAIAVRGSKDVPVANKDRFLELVKIQHERMKGPASRKYKTLGTPENVLVLNALGAMPVNNFERAVFPDADKISGEYLNERFVAKIIGCSSCAMRCEHIAVVPEGPYKGTTTRIEYEPLWAMGPNCGVGNLDAILKGMDLSNYYGVDAISIGGIISFAMDLYKHGLIGKEAVGLELNFGNHEAMIEMIKKISTREGFGDILAEGVRIAADKVGKDASKYAVHIKGVEMTGYDIRGLKTAALGYAVSFRGADHNRHGAYGPDVAGKVNRFKAERGRGKLVKDTEDLYTIIDSLIVCKFSRGTYYDGYKDLAALFSAVTGIEMSADELKMAGERINNLGRLINIREGLTRKDDTLPWKVMHVPIPDEGVSKGSFVSQEELDLLLDDYYEVRGWTKEGIPTIEKLDEIGMGDLTYIVKDKLELSHEKSKRKSKMEE